MYDLTEYEQLMNQAAEYYKHTGFDSNKDLKKAFIKYIEARSSCYSRQAIQMDAVHCLGFAHKDTPWRDLKGRVKHNPDELLAERQANTQPQRDEVVESVIAAIQYAEPSLRGNKRTKTRKVIR